MRFSLSCLVIFATTIPLAESTWAQEPTPAQFHIRHVMESINGAPDNVGLLAALEQEAKIAAQHATLAVSDLTDLESIQKHVKHVRHAVDPSVEPKGPGKGFGVMRAAKGVDTHIMLAAKADGNTEHIKRHATHVATSARNVVTWSTAILAESEKVAKAEEAKKAAEAAQKIQTLIQQVLEGVDENGDGKVSWERGEGGLAQAKQHGKLLAGGGGGTSGPP